MFIVVHEDNDYKETIINLDTVHYIRKMDDPKVSQCKNIN